MALNGAPSAVALALTKLFQWSFGINSSDTSKVQWVQLLAAGFGAMTLLRSSLLTFRAGDDPIAVGPGKLLLTLLTAVGRAVDRTRAEDRSKKVAALMSDVTYVKALAALPAYCLGLMQNLTDDEQKAFAGQLTSISKVANAKVQSMLLGLAIMNAMGAGVLDTAVCAATVGTFEGRHVNATGFWSRPRFGLESDCIECLVDGDREAHPRLLPVILFESSSSSWK
jgi:hypothetical protein